MSALAVAQLVLALVLGLVFCVMGVLHFVPGVARGMGAMIPVGMRGPFSARVLVRFTGVCEVLGGVGLVVPWTRLVAGIALCVFLVAVFPANAYAARNPSRFGRAAVPLVPRAIAQVVVIGLVVLVVVPV